MTKINRGRPEKDSKVFHKTRHKVSIQESIINRDVIKEIFARVPSPKRAIRVGFLPYFDE